LSLPLAQSAAQNRLLTALAPSDFIRLSSLLEPVSLEFGDRLEEAGQVVGHIYFPGPGAASVIASTPDGRRLEVGMIGPEGMSGLALLQGTVWAAHDILVQIPFRAQRIRADDLSRLLSESPALHATFLKFAHAFFVQVSQTALCNGHYTIEQRLSRWILMCHDRADREDLPLTHEYLSAMLGVRRAGITTALRSLERAGAVGVKRGSISVRDRDALVAIAGGAYGASEAEYERLFGNGRDEPPVPEGRYATSATSARE
jgi:CRP-like cAMP-binding protein